MKALLNTKKVKFILMLASAAALGIAGVYFYAISKQREEILSMIPRADFEHYLEYGKNMKMEGRTPTELDHKSVWGSAQVYETFCITAPGVSRYASELSWGELYEWEKRVLENDGQFDPVGASATMMVGLYSQEDPDKANEYINRFCSLGNIITNAEKIVGYWSCAYNNNSHSVTYKFQEDGRVRISGDSGTALGNYSINGSQYELNLSSLKVIGKLTFMSTNEFHLSSILLGGPRAIQREYVCTRQKRRMRNYDSGAPTGQY